MVCMVITVKLLFVVSSCDEYNMTDRSSSSLTVSIQLVLYVHILSFTHFTLQGKFPIFYVWHNSITFCNPCIDCIKSIALTYLCTRKTSLGSTVRNSADCLCWFTSMLLTVHSSYK